MTEAEFFALSPEDRDRLVDEAVWGIDRTPTTPGDIGNAIFAAVPVGTSYPGDDYDYLIEVDGVRWKLFADQVEDIMQASTTLDLIAPAEQRQPIVDSIRRYRKATAQLYAGLMLAQQAGATIEETEENGLRVTPHNASATVALATSMGAARVEKQDKPSDHKRGDGTLYHVRTGSALAYECRQWFLHDLLPTALSFVWDSARRDAQTAWTARDPEFPQATRGWLTLQLARGPAKFQRRGIGLPLATAKPKMAGRTLTLKWDREIGAVEFTLPQMDGGRYHVWRALRDGDEGWSLGTVYLTEADGKLRAVLTHERPDKIAVVDAGRVCRVQIDASNPEQFIAIRGPDGQTTIDDISGVESQAWIVKMYARRKTLEARRAACGNPRRPWGHRHGWLATQDVLSNVTRLRDLGQRDRNHAWSRRIATRAADWRCGVIEVALNDKESRPDARGRVGELFGHPWRWPEFFADLRYKTQSLGIEVRMATAPVVE